MSDFLPEGYKVPVNGNYMKFVEGDNTFRVLGSAVVGYEYWNNKDEGVRSRVPFVGIPADIRYEIDKKTGESKPSRIKHFWAFPVWNVEGSKVQILQVTQQGVMDAIKALVENKKWGDPKGYDITVSRSGSGFDTEYQVMPNPHTPIAAEAAAAFAAMPINLNALFDNGDPFAPVDPTVPVGVPTDDQQADEEFSATGKREAPDIVKKHTPPAETGGDWGAGVDPTI
ncbi:hypothetical protein EDE08_101624 [Bradyrhizobium sp. R2.2-H]|jgi:hypothetical protein|uniref:hypothetical protein n=1 Tax=unclassified Bradyrhizobium TaxID=2631580 RepID=UPI0010449893|nr:MULTISPECIES: hypothetical protein [unclassified Bradyrhizobium]TCU78842.1 hypothetical protein EDE10_101625 [Bradyrhizobium sp. Y-H1]TCU80925.1 hypothetical protein EDE08_101624 [Bradyrhizobium sp. R2.2-H]